MGQQGILLSSVAGAPAALLVATRAAIAAGRPVILQIPSAWNDEPPPTSGSTHAVVAVRDTGSGLVCMNPWGGFWHAGNYAYWQARVRYGVIWTAQKKAGAGMTIPAGWKDDGETLTAPNGHVVTLGFRAAVLDADTWNPNNQPLSDAYRITLDGEKGTRQDFRDAALMWTPSKNVWTHPYGPEILDLRSQLAAANKTIVELQSQLASAGGSADPTATALVKALQVALAAHQLAA